MKNHLTRPKRNQQPDKNHAIVSKALMHRCGGGHRDEFGVYHAHLRGLRVVAYDLSKGGGEMVDWLVLVSWLPIFFEVKRVREINNPAMMKLTETERLQRLLEPGEKVFLTTCPAITSIVTDEDQVYALMDRAADFIFSCEEGTQNRSEFLRLFFPKLGIDYLPKEESQDAEYIG